MAQAERRLIKDLIAGNIAAGDEFVRIWQPRIISWIKGRASSIHVVEYAQEVWRHLFEDDWRRLLQWKGLYDDEAWNPRSLDAYLKWLTIYKVIDLQRREMRYPRPDMDPADILDEDGPSATDSFVQIERARLETSFIGCTSRFDEKDQRLIQMWWEGYPGSEIATALGMEPQNVYQRRFYLLKQLRACLVDKLPEYFHHV